MLKDPKIIVRELASQVGKHEAQKLLVDEGVSTSTAQKLVSDRYKPEIKELVRQAIGRAIEAAKSRKLIA